MSTFNFETKTKSATVIIDSGAQIPINGLYVPSVLDEKRLRVVTKIDGLRSFFIDLDQDTVVIDTVPFAGSTASDLYDSLETLFFLGQVPESPLTGDVELISVDGVKQWKERPYTVNGDNNEDGTTKGDWTIFGELLVQGNSVIISNTLGIGGSNELLFIENMLNGNLSYIASSEVINGISGDPRIPELFDPFVKTDPQGQQQTDDSETFSSTPFVETETGITKHFLSEVFFSQIDLITFRWYIRSLSGLKNAYIKAWIGTVTDPNTLEPNWKSNTDKEISNKTNLVTNIGGAGIDIPFKLGKSYSQKAGDTLSFIIYADDPFSLQGATFVAPPPFSTQIPYITADGTNWKYTELAKKEHLIQTPYTSVIEGGVVTEAISGTPGLFDLTEGNGRVVEYTDANDPIETAISWPEMLDVAIPDILTETFSSVYFDSNGALQITGGLLTGSELRRNNITLATILHEDNTSITGLTDESVPAYNGVHALVDYAKAQGGAIIGSEITTPNTDLTFAQNAGTFTMPFVNRSSKGSPITQQNSGTDPVLFNYTYRDGSGGFTPTGLITEIDPTQYDDGSGTLQPVGIPNPDWTWQPVYYFGQANRIVIGYGQIRYNTKEDALSGILTDFSKFVSNPLFAEGKLLGFFLLEEGATDLTDDSEAEFVLVSSAFSSGGTTGGANITEISHTITGWQSANYQESFLHGFGTDPSAVNIYGVCTVANGGYAVGDKVDLKAAQSYLSTGNVGFTLMFNATSVEYVGTDNPNTLRIWQRDGSNAALTMVDSQWDIRIDAYKFN